MLGTALSPFYGGKMERTYECEKCGMQCTDPGPDPELARCSLCGGALKPVTLPSPTDSESPAADPPIFAEDAPTLDDAGEPGLSFESEPGDEGAPEDEEGLRLEAEAVPPAREEVNVAPAGPTPPPQPVAVAGPPGPRRSLTAGQWLGWWVLTVSLAGCVLGANAIGLASPLSGTGTAWTAFLAFAACVGLAALGSLLQRGHTPARLCQKALAIAGFLVCAVFLLEALVAVAARLAGPGVGMPRLEASTVAVFLAAAGVALHVQALRAVGWAKRCQAVAVLSVVVLALAHHCRGEDEFHALVPAAQTWVEQRWIALIALGLSVGGLAWHLMMVREHERPRLRHQVFGFLWLGLMLGALGWVAMGSRPTTWSGELSPLLAVTAMCALIGLLPVALVGAFAAWRGLGKPREDLLAAASAGWYVILAGGVLLVLACLAGGRAMPPMERWTIVFGALSLAVIAWLGQHQDKRGPALRPPSAAALWGVFLMAPTAILALSQCASLQALLRSGCLRGANVAAGMLTTYLWASLSIGGIAIAAAMVVKSFRDLRHEPQRAEKDARILCTAGWALGATVLALCILGGAVAPAVRAHLRPLAAPAGNLVVDLARISAGWQAGDAVGSLPYWAGRLAPSSRMLLAAVACAALALTVLLHLAAGRGVAWARFLVAVLWAPLLVLATALASAFAARVFVPVDCLTPVGQAIADSLALRLGLLALLACVLLRLWYSLLALLERLKSPADGLERAASGGSGWPQMIGCGIVLCTLAALGCLLLGAAGSAGDMLFQFREFATSLAYGAAGGLGRAATLARQWPAGYGVAVVAILVGLMAMHDQTRRGRVAAMPWVAALWSMLLLRCGYAGWRAFQRLNWPWPPGIDRVLALAALIWIIVAVNVYALWARWWLLRKDNRPVTRRGPAATIGNLGLLVSVAVLVLLLWDLAVPQIPAPHRHAIAVGLVNLSTVVHGGAASFLGVMTAMALTLGALAIGSHYAARKGTLRMRQILRAFCFVAMLVCVFAAGSTLGLLQIGSWSAAQALRALLLLGVIIVLVDITVSPWLMRVGPLPGADTVPPAGPEPV